ncbi:hypothetical protein SLS58_004041 [Diplodia intermedia]|uniref:Uncharacterized protein n=1 Tax=Diplodia intermedia TaxID=856260 RepID=A0ABR3TV67_9PEZI
MGGRHRWQTPTGTALDDPTPVMAQVSYTIEAKLVYSKQRDNRRRRRRLQSSSSPAVVANASRGVCVVPAFPESPPIFLHAPPSYSSSPEEEETQYRLRHEKTIGGGGGGFRSRGKAGCLVVQVPQQPGALRGGLVRAKSSSSSSSSSSSPASVMLLLRFDPAAASSASPPPRLEDVKRSLRATTVFRAGVMEGPEYGKLVGGGEQQRRSYSEAVPLPSLRVSGARWRRCEPGWAHEGLLEGGRRPEEEESAVVAPSSRYAGGVYYLMRLQIPVEYPAGKALVPTFRSCLVERSYRLDVAVTLSAFSSVAVRVPVQLCT